MMLNRALLGVLAASVVQVHSDDPGTFPYTVDLGTCGAGSSPLEIDCGFAIGGTGTNQANLNYKFDIFEVGCTGSPLSSPSGSSPSGSTSETQDVGVAWYEGDEGEQAAITFNLPAVASIDSVALDLAHTFSKDFAITLGSPNGDTFTIINNDFDGSDMGQVDGDGTLGNVATYTFARTGSARPSTNVCLLPNDVTYAAGEFPPEDEGYAAGDWTITVEDGCVLDGGAIGAVTINYTPAEGGGEAFVTETSPAGATTSRTIKIDADFVDANESVEFCIQLAIGLNGVYYDVTKQNIKINFVKDGEFDTIGQIEAVPVGAVPTITGTFGVTATVCESDGSALASGESLNICIEPTEVATSAISNVVGVTIAKESGTPSFGAVVESSLVGLTAINGLSANLAEPTDLATVTTVLDISFFENGEAVNIDGVVTLVITEARRLGLVGLGDGEEDDARRILQDEETVDVDFTLVIDVEAVEEECGFICWILSIFGL